MRLRVKGKKKGKTTCNVTVWKWPIIEATDVVHMWSHVVIKLMTWWLISPAKCLFVPFSLLLRLWEEPSSILRLLGPISTADLIISVIFPRKEREKNMSNQRWTMAKNTKRVYTWYSLITPMAISFHRHLIVFRLGFVVQIAEYRNTSTRKWTKGNVAWTRTKQRVVALFFNSAKLKQ